jgi:hypothetical protein
MQMFCRRVGALLVALCVALPCLVRAAQEPAVRPPLAWLAIHSYQRVEQRLREFASLTQVPGLAGIVLGLVQFQFAGLRGLDQQRPIGVLIPSFTPAAEPELVFTLPYTDRATLLSTLRIFFPQMTVSDGVFFLQGEPAPTFGRLDDQAAVLLLSRVPEALRGLDAGLPADLFGASPDGPDVVFRVDVDAARQRHEVAWQALLSSMADARDAAWHVAEQEASSFAEQAFLTAYFALAERQLRRFLLDLSRAELRVTLHPKGWSADLEARLHPGSATAAFFNHQRQHVSRATPLFSPQTTARFISTTSLTADLRRELVTLLHLGYRATEARMAAETSRPSAPRPTAIPGLASLARFFDQWLTEEVVEIAAELRLRPGSGLELTGWIPLAEGRKRLDQLLDALGRFFAALGHEVVITRDAVQHHDIPLHRLDFPAAEGTHDMPGTVFLSAQDGFLIIHVGASPEPVMQLLDRIREYASQPPPRTDTLQRLELVPARLLAADLGTGMSPDASERAIIAQILQGSDEPLRIEVQAHDHAVVQHYVLPSPYIQGLAGIMGQQLLEHVRKSLLGR